MRQIYVETSAILCWLFNEKLATRIIATMDNSEQCVSSVLSIIETERSLVRVRQQNVIKTAELQRLRGMFHSYIRSWHFLEITSKVRARAAEPFPTEPVRTLDAIHLASALEFQFLYPELFVLSLDQRIVDNLIPLGLQG